MEKLLKFLSLATLAAVVCVMAYSSYAVFVLNEMQCTYEEGCMEVLQAVILGTCCVLYFVSLFKGDNSERAILLFCLVLCYAGFLREVDFDKMGLGAFADFMLYGGGRYATIILGFTVSLGWAALHYKTYVKTSLKFVFSPVGLLWFLGGFFTILGEIAETSTLQYNAFWEETFELLGYCFILASAVWILKHGGITPGGIGESGSLGAESL